MRILKIVFLLTIAQFRLAYAADLIRILPVTNEILRVTFDEGHIDYFGHGGNRYDGNVIYYDALKITDAVNRENYQVLSSDDSNYLESINPVYIGRKAKGFDFNNLYEPAEPQSIKHHWIYLQLPYPLQSGKSYKIVLEDIASNFNQYEFVFDEFQLRSPALHVNQIGYVPEAPKYAYISHFMGNFDHGIHQDGGLELDEFQGACFFVVRMEDDSVVFTGEIEKRTDKTQTTDFTNDEFENKSSVTRADIWQCDFSSFQRPGEYRIVVENIGSSYPFEIKSDIYREPYYYLAKGMFTHRQGIIQDLSYYWEGLEYPADHRTDQGVNMYYFADKKDHHTSEVTPNDSLVTGIWGWYHDAGDWDGYAHHFRVPLTLLLLYDMKPENFGDREIKNRYKINTADPWINESGNGIADILDEAAWLVRFYKRSWDALKAQGYEDAGVPGYVGVDAGTDDGIPSWEDTRDLALYGGNGVKMAYIYAATSGWLSICLDKNSGGEIDSLDSSGWLDEAIQAYSWAKEHGEDTNSRLIASAVLYRATKENEYQRDFIAAKSNCGSWDYGNWSSIQEWNFACWNYLNISSDTHADLDLSVQEECSRNITRHAEDEAVAPANDRGFRWALDKNNNFMLGTFSTPHIVLPAMAYELTGDQRYLDVCYTTCDYHLGGNEMNLVWVTMLGDQPEISPFNIDSWSLFDFSSNVYREPFLPGIVPYGNHNTGDWQQGEEWSWVGDEDFSRSTAVPGIANFPDAETRFFNRNSIAGSEYTVHQTMNQALFAYGYLCDDFQEGGSYEPNRCPEVKILIEDNLEVSMADTLQLKAVASEDTRRIEYYYGWHYIGESFDQENQFLFNWDLALYQLSKGRMQITAKAFDDKGMVSRPSDSGKTVIKILYSNPIKQGAIPELKFDLGQNYPNPFNTSTQIQYQLSDRALTNLSVFDLNGRRTETLVNEIQSPGRYHISWDADQYPSGVYFYQIDTGINQKIKKCMLIK